MCVEDIVNGNREKGERAFKGNEENIHRHKNVKASSSIVVQGSEDTVSRLCG